MLIILVTAFPLGGRWLSGNGTSGKTYHGPDWEGNFADAHLPTGRSNAKPASKVQLATLPVPLQNRLDQAET